MSKEAEGLEISKGATWKRLLLLGVGVLVAWWVYSYIREAAKRDDFIPVDLSGKQHIGPNNSIAPFFLNGTNGFNVGREGGGGSDVCCVLLPKQWRPGLSVDLRWAVANWANENHTDIYGDDAKSLTFNCFRAKVPVERYEVPGRVVVHFFASGKARVVVGLPGPDELRHSILPVNSRAADVATVGKPADDLFTKEEYNEMERQESERKKKYGGDWK